MTGRTAPDNGAGVEPAGGEPLSPSPDAPLRGRFLRRLLRTARVLGWTAAAIVGLLALGVVLYTPRTSDAAARRMAQRELATLIDSGETVEASAFVTQRHWWNYYHQTHGVLALTERRILFLGVEPRGLIDPSVDDAPILDVRSWPYDSVGVTPARPFLGTARGVAFTARDGREAFAVARVDWDALQRVTTNIHRVQARLRTTADSTRRAAEYAAWLARQPVYHVVRPGDALFTVAGLYNLTPDSLRALNRLEGDRIRIGERLLVKP